MDKLHNDLIEFATQHDIPFELSCRKKVALRAFFESIYQAFISSTIDELALRFSTHQKLAVKISKLMPLHVKEVEFAGMKNTFEFYHRSTKNLVYPVLLFYKRHTGHSTYFETKYKSIFSFIFKQLLQKMFDMGSVSIVN